MRVFDDWPEQSIRAQALVTIGAFDGLHVGHQELLCSLMQRAHEMGWISAVVTFNPLPKAVLNPGAPLPCLMSIKDKARQFEEWGLDLLIVLPFTHALAATPAEQFVTTLANRLCIAELWVGWDFALGRDRQGTISLLKEMGARLGFSVRVAAPVQHGGAPVSSTRIRNALLAGDVAEASQMLGRPYRLRATVLPGITQSNGDARELLLQPLGGCAVPGANTYAGHLVADNTRLPALIIVPHTNSVQTVILRAYPLEDHRQLPTLDVEIEFAERLDVPATGQLHREMVAAKEALSWANRMKK